MKENRIFGYDLVRAVAIILVLVGHSLGFLYSGEYSFFISFLSGFFGVELFFILSGVLIGQLLIDVFSKSNDIASLKNFIIRRWLRTLPLYYLMLGVYYVGDHFFDSVQNEGVSLIRYIFFMQNFFWVQPSFFGVSWSLSIEEWFYVLFPLMLILIKKGQRKLSLKSLFIIAVSFFLIYFLALRFLSWEEGRFHFYEGVRKIAFLRLDSIAFGILAAVAIHFYHDIILRKRNFLALIGLILLITNQYVIFMDDYSNLKYFNTVYYSILGFGIALMFPFFKTLKRPSLFTAQMITYISKISYSLYLVHWIFFRFFDSVYFSLLPNVFKFILFFVFSIAASGFLYAFFEKPLLRLRDRFVPR